MLTNANIVDHYLSIFLINITLKNVDICLHWKTDIY